MQDSQTKKITPRVVEKFEDKKKWLKFVLNFITYQLIISNNLKVLFIQLAIC